MTTDNDAYLDALDALDRRDQADADHGADTDEPDDAGEYTTGVTFRAHPDPARCDCGGSGWVPGIGEDEPCPHHAATARTGEHDYICGYPACACQHFCRVTGRTVGRPAPPHSSAGGSFRAPDPQQFFYGPLGGLRYGFNDEIDAP